MFIFSHSNCYNVKVLVEPIKYKFKFINNAKGKGSPPDYLMHISNYRSTNVSAALFSLAWLIHN